jgi:hypothetical protein
MQRSTPLGIGSAGRAHARVSQLGTPSVCDVRAAAWHSCDSRADCRLPAHPAGFRPPGAPFIACASAPQRRLLLGALAAVALGAFALVPTARLAAPPSAPLFTYLRPLLRAQVGGWVGWRVCVCVWWWWWWWGARAARDGWAARLGKVPRGKGSSVVRSAAAAAQGPANGTERPCSLDRWGSTAVPHCGHASALSHTTPHHTTPHHTTPHHTSLAPPPLQALLHDAGPLADVGDGAALSSLVSRLQRPPVDLQANLRAAAACEAPACGVVWCGVVAWRVCMGGWMGASVWMVGGHSHSARPPWAAARCGCLARPRYLVPTRSACE